MYQLDSRPAFKHVSSGPAGLRDTIAVYIPIEWGAHQRAEFPFWLGFGRGFWQRQQLQLISDELVSIFVCTNSPARAAASCPGFLDESVTGLSEPFPKGLLLRLESLCFGAGGLRDRLSNREGRFALRRSVSSMLVRYLRNDGDRLNDTSKS